MFGTLSERAPDFAWIWSDSGTSFGDLGWIMDGFYEVWGKIFAACGEDLEDKTMIRATKGTSIDR